MIDKSLLRDLIKSVIAEEVAAIRKPAQGGNASAPQSNENVRITSDADLVAFARRVLSLAGDPKRARDIAAGRYPFRLDAASAPTAATRAPAAKAAPASASVSSQQSLRVESGVVTESMLNKLPRGQTRLLLAPGVTVTPLAKDRARALGLTFERT